MDPASQATTRLVRVGAYAICLNDEDHILLARVARGYPDTGRWAVPGGGVEWGESPQEAMVREVAEEAGLDVLEHAGVVGVYSKAYERDRYPLHHIGIIYRVTSFTGVPRAETDGSTDACAWFSPDDCATLPLTSLASYAVPLAWPSA